MKQVSLVQDKLPERFYKKFTIDSNGCWLWTSRIQKTGYALYYVASGHSGGKEVRAHKWAYEHIFGEVASGLVLDHLCAVKHCVNPDHLEAVTSRVNTLRYHKNSNTINMYSCPTCGHQHYLAEKPKW